MSQKSKKKAKSKAKAKELAKRRKVNRQIESGKAQKTMPVRRLTDEEFMEWKGRFQELIDDANQRIRNLRVNGLTTTFLERISEGNEYFRFDIEDINSPNQLRAYMTKVRGFMNDVGNNNDKAMLETAMLMSTEFKGQFGNNYPLRFNMNRVFDEQGKLIRERIDPEIARRAFANYRRLEEKWAAVIGRQVDEGVFGSETLIIALYAVEARGMDSLDFGNELLEAFTNETLRQWEGLEFSFTKADAILNDWDSFFRRNF